MIKVDISNVWGQVTLSDLLAMEKEVAAAHTTLADGTGAGNDFLGWQNLPVREATEEITRIQRAAEKIRSDSDVFVVIGIGGSYLGPRAAIELLQGPNHNIGKGKGNPQIFFAGNGLSTRHWNELTRLLEGKDFSIAIISKSGTTTEPAIATRALRWMLERKYGTEGAKSRIYAITDPCKGALRQMATEEGWETFVIPPDVGGRYSVLTPVGLLPLAVAGIDIMEMMNGAADAKESYNLRSFENPVWQYAAVRNLLYRNGKAMEIFESYEPGFKMFGGWWQQLFGESEGKDGKGIFPASVVCTTDLHSMGQYIQEGERIMFETTVVVENSNRELVIGSDPDNLDQLNYLAGSRVEHCNSMARLGTKLAHIDGGVPQIEVAVDRVCEESLGALFYFFEFACGVSAYTLGINPFNQPGVEAYKKNMFALLRKPGYEARTEELLGRL